MKQPSSTQRRRMPRRGLIAAGVVVAAIIVFFLVFDWNWLKSPIESRVSEATGRRFEIQGALSGTWSLHPRVRMQGVRFANPEWAHDPEFLTADGVEVRIALFSLLTGPIHFLDVVLDKPVLGLERDSEGRSTWQFDRRQSEAGSAPRVDRLQINSGTLNFRDAQTASELSVAFATAADGSATHFDGKGTYRAQSLAASGTTAPLLRLEDTSAPLPLAVHGQIANTRFSFDGTLQGLTRFEAVDAQYEVQGPTLKEVGRLFAAPLPETPPYRIAGRLKHSGLVWESTDLKGRFGNSDVQGTVKLTRAQNGGKPELDTELNSHLLDLADLGPLIGTTGTPAPAPEGGTRLFPTRVFDLSRVDVMNAHVLLKAGQVVHAGDFPFDDFLADFTMRDSRITIDPLDFGMAGGKLHLKVDVDAHAPIATHVEGRLRGMRVAKIFPNKGATGEAAGTLSGYINLGGRGNSVAAMAGSADGRAVLVLNGGRVPSLLPAIIDLDGASVLSNFLKGADPENVTCTALDFNLAGGIATPAVAVVETETTVLTLTGSLDLKNESADMRIEQAPKHKSILSLRTPITMTGPLRQPRFGLAPAPLALRSAAAVALGLINPLAAVFALIETGPGEDGTCASLRQGLRNSAKLGAAPAEPAPPSARAAP